MPHPFLDPHHVIAWDMDDTLIGANPHAATLRQYIIDHPEKVHIIVTFRNKDWADLIPSELDAHGVPPERIHAIHDCPEYLFRAFMMHQQFAFLDDEIVNYHLRKARVTMDEIESRVEAFMAWKGMKAAEIGATVLIDDRIDLVADGCRQRGIVLIDSIRLAIH